MVRGTRRDFPRFAKVREESFWNNIDLSKLFSQHLNESLLAFLPGLFHFGLEHYSWKKKIDKAFQILKRSIIPTKGDFSVYFSSSRTFKVSAYMLFFHSHEYNYFLWDLSMPKDREKKARFEIHLMLIPVWIWDRTYLWGRVEYW